jgi:K+-transporting ATPase ATPase A chain
MVKNQGHGWTIWGVMLALFLAGVLGCWWAESFGNPRLATLGLDPSFGNMEGKEVRFGVAGSALFATVTTDASCGAVNAMLDSFTPLGGLVPLINIQLGEVVFGGVGSGLYGMLIFVVLTVFLAGLMVGRTPEYLGKKIEASDVKACMFSIMVPVFAILGFTSWASLCAWGPAGLGNTGPHGLTELLYAFSSTTGNNGSAFAGLTTNTVRFNTILAVAMLLGRYLMIMPVLALARNLAGKKVSPAGSGSFPLAGFLFGALLLGVILILGALTFFPVLSLGPIVEHLLMLKSSILY